MSRSSNVAAALALTLCGVWGAYAYVENRDMKDYSGTVDRFSMINDADGARIDYKRPVYLESGAKLGFSRAFKDALTPGQCYDFKLVNTVSQQVLTGALGDIIAATPCAG